MSIALSKLCADFLSQNHVFKSTDKLKDSRSRELVAAFCGDKSNAAYQLEV